MKFEKNSGITLIALIITIIILLILASVSILTVIGENGIVKKTDISKENTRGGRVKERIELWKANYEIELEVGDEISQTQEELLRSLEEELLLTTEEKDKLEKDKYITIGEISISISNGIEDKSYI